MNRTTHNLRKPVSRKLVLTIRHSVANPRFGFALRAVLALVLLCVCAHSLAATPAGTVIRNQASAVYTDDTGVEYTVTSNVVETLIEQVAGLELVQSQQLQSTPGAQVNFSHRITNTGNGDDRYSLVVVNENGDSLDLDGLSVYLDLDQNGIADSNVPTDITPWVPAGNDLYLIVSGTVPSNAAINSAAVISISAASQFDGSVFLSNSNTVIVDEGAVIEFTKSISSNSGVSPSGPYTVTISYNNTGTQAANEVTLIDALPEGMVYVPGSGVWNLSGSALTDVDPFDYQAGSTTRIRYCAYDDSCTNLAESQIDADISSINQVTAIIESVQPGEFGNIQFDFTIAPLLSAGTIVNQAEAQFDSGGATQPRIYSNGVGFTVLHQAGVVANGSRVTAIDGMNEPISIASAPLAGTVDFENIIWNTGNSVDTFNMEVDVATTSFPANTVYRLLKADGATPLLDTNQDGWVDTGPVQPGQFAVVVLQMQLPFGVSGNNNGVGFDIRKIAHSSNDSTVSNDIVDHLDEIVSNQVDLTNQAPAGSKGALGSGPGPESLPLSVVTLDANGLATFDLHVRHQGAVSGSYDLSAHANAAGGALPAGWQLVFTNAANGSVVTNTGLLASGESRHLVARLSVPINSTFVEQSIYFKAISPQNGASDIKHDAVRFVQNAQLSLTPSLSAQVTPGGSVVYEHVISNVGNQPLNDILFSVQNSAPQWQSSLYADTDSNGFLSPADLLISGPMALLPGESADVFLKVFAPAGASLGLMNNTAVQASSDMGMTNSAVNDVTTVSESQVSIRKEQAVDVGCDGQPDAGNDFTPSPINVAPGNNCVIYRLTAVNNGVLPSYNVVIRDYTPPYTVYAPTATCSRTPCWINEPDINQTGTVNAETDQLLPGDTYYLQFSVKVQ